MRKLKRSLGMPLASVLLGLSISGLAGSTVAADAPLATHPSVGSWVIQTEHGGTITALGLARITADGSVRLSGDSLGIGAWEPTGPSTAEVLLVQSRYPSAGLMTMDAQIQVSDDGLTLSGTYVVDPRASDAGSADSAADDLIRANLTGERVTVRTSSGAGQFEGCSRTVRFC